MLVPFSSCLSPDVWQVVTRSTLCENAKSGHCFSEQWTRFPSLFIWPSSCGKQKWDRRSWGKQIMQGELNSGFNNRYIFKNLYLKKIKPKPHLVYRGGFIYQKAKARQHLKLARAINCPRPFWNHKRLSPLDFVCGSNVAKGWLTPQEEPFFHQGSTLQLSWHGLSLGKDGNLFWKTLCLLDHWLCPAEELLQNMNGALDAQTLGGKRETLLLLVSEKGGNSIACSCIRDRKSVV